MSCINFRTKEKNNKWREVALDLEKEKSISKYFGVDTETRVDELLQNNITLLDWIRKNQGFPYFIGRRINGKNALTSEEISYITACGSKVIPILTAVTEKTAKDNAKIAIALLEDLAIEKDTPIFVEMDASNVTDEFLKDFVTEVLSSGYIPGFYVDTDSYNNFDRFFSRAYQSNEELMKQCKIWALSPEMEEFYETKNSHSEKPEIWGPFAPSCISKKQIAFWQYGKKCHPINTYNGNEANFNLNLTIEPNNIFSVREAKILSCNFEENQNYNYEACVTDGDNVETVTLSCDFVKAKSCSPLTNNKVYAKIIDSSHDILEFIICQNNDLFSRKNIVTEGTALIKLAFVSKQCSRVYHSEKIVSLEDCKLFQKVIASSPVTEHEEEIQKVSSQETWFTKFVTQKDYDVSNDGQSSSDRTNSIVENYMYKANEDIFASEIITVSKMRSKISGDTYNIFETIPQSAVKRLGTECCTLKDTYGRPIAAYYKDTARDFDGSYYSRVALWSLNPTISTAQSADRLVEFVYQKSYNALVIYYPNTDKIEVVYCPDDQTYVITTNTQIAINLVGCQSAYVNKCSFEVCLGGKNTGSVNFLDDALSMLGLVTKEITILGKLVGMVSNIWAAFSILSETADAITNYNYNKATHEYSFYPQQNLVAKQVGSTFAPLLANKNSSLKIRATLNNVTVYPNSAVYCQVQTKVLTNSAGEDEIIRIGGVTPLQ